MSSKNIVILSLSVFSALILSQPACYAGESLDNLEDLSFNQLENVVTSVSKRPENAFTAAAAVYVITQEDIKNSGLRSIPEILRMAPGLQVTQVDAKSWAITSRGFNADGFGNKLLVLIDGRSVYTPLFSGVYWNAQDTYIEDIERIEIIRGPGATLWGANAVNGVINIITKRAKDTQTTTVSAGLGTETKNFVEAQHGGITKNNMYYRVYGKHSGFDSSRTTIHTDGGNSWDSNQAGFRMDWDKEANNQFTLQGDAYINRENLDLFLPDTTHREDKFDVSGGNLLHRWTHEHENGAQSTTQIYYDFASADYSLLDQDHHTLDVDYQLTKDLNDRNTLIWGAGYRYIRDRLKGSNFISYTPTERGRNLFTTFIQDDLKLIPDTLNITFGSKFEHNDFTGFEIQPSVRTSWLINDNNTMWASVSRAVRTPNRSEDDLSLVILPGYIRWLGNHGFDSEELMAYEVGYRNKDIPNLLIDATAFVNKYNKLRTNEVSSQPLPLDTILGLEFDNKAKATSYGFELAATYDVTNYWKIKGSYTYLEMDVDLTDNSTDIVATSQEGISPQNQFSIQSSLYLPHSVSISNSLYYVDSLPALAVPSYLRFDSQITWQPTTNLELSLVGQNLLDNSHQEFSAPLHGIANEIQRNVYGKATWRF